MERGKSKEKLNSLSTLLKNFSSFFFLHNLTYPNDIQNFFFTFFPVILVTEFPLLAASKSPEVPLFLFPCEPTSCIDYA